MEGNIWVVDQYNYKVQKFDSTGKFLLQIRAYGVNDSQFIYPYDVAVDKEANVYVSDFYTNKIQKFSSNGVFLKSFGGKGIGEGLFEGLSGITIDQHDNLIASDFSNPKIAVFSGSGDYLFGYSTSNSTISTCITKDNRILVAGASSTPHIQILKESIVTVITSENSDKLNFQLFINSDGNIESLESPGVNRIVISNLLGQSEKFDKFPIHTGLNGLLIINIYTENTVVSKSLLKLNNQ